jgi:tungstate transport system ATP-binding protein
MHLDKFNRTLIRIKPEKNINCLPIYIKDLSLILDERKILSSLNLSINSDDVTVIMGPNGAGKSIFLKILNGILTPTSGCITWNNKKQFSDTLNTQAFVFQKPILLRRSVIANLDYMDSVLGYKKKISKDRLLEIVQLKKQKNQPARMLSLGEQQRLSLIRSLMLRPNLLLLDEPTANLDPASTKIIEDIILNLKMMGIKIIFVTHNILQAKRIADEIIFLNEGKMVEHLNKQEFFSNSKSIEVQNYLNGIL